MRGLWSEPLGRGLLRSRCRVNRVQALAVGLLIGSALTLGALAVSPAFAQDPPPAVEATPISAEVTERIPGHVSAGGEPLPTHVVVHVYRRSVRVAADGAVLYDYEGTRG